MGNRATCQCRDRDVVRKTTDEMQEAGYLRELVLGKRRDPLVEFDTIEVVGAGSMGNVLKVRRNKLEQNGEPVSGHTLSLRSVELMLGLISISSVPSIFDFCVRCRRSSEVVTPLLSVNYSNSPATSSTVIDSFTPQGSALGSERDIIKALRSPSKLHNSAELTGTNHRVVYALKSVNHKRRCAGNSRALQNEIEILKSLDHPAIVKPFEIYHHRRQIFLLTEFLSGGNLYQRDPYTEKEAMRIMRSALLAVAYMHSKNVVHRDIKYENIMFVSSGPESDIKVIDFGLATMISPDKYLKTGVGTMITMAPEIFEQGYNSQVDLWSLGVLTYMLLSSQVPFTADSCCLLKRKIKKGKYFLRSRRWKHVSQDAVAFVSQLLQINPSKRPTANEALQLEWLRKTSEPSHLWSKIFVGKIKASMIAFAGYNLLKKLAFITIAFKSASSEERMQKALFIELDKDHDGRISIIDLKAYFEKECSEQELNLIFQGARHNDADSIPFSKFVVATIEATRPVKEEKIWEVFCHLESNDHGFVSKRTLHKTLCKVFSKEDAGKFMEKVYPAHTRKISSQAFLDLCEAPANNPEVQS